MWELTEDNAIDYLRERGWITSPDARVEPLSGGVSNIVLRVIDGDRLMVLKQSRPQLRTREAWYSDVERIWREQEVIRFLAPRLPPGSIPGLLHEDFDRYTFAMEHAPIDATPWKPMLLAGDARPEIARLAGQLLAQIHNVSANLAGSTVSLHDKSVFVQLRVDPFYRRILQRHPDLIDRVEPLIQAMADERLGLCHGDFSPKNILVHSKGITLVDHETGHLGEIAMDLGFFFSHLVLKAIHKAIHRQKDFARYTALILAAWAGYRDTLAQNADERWSVNMGHLGVCIIARVDGTSPVDYLQGGEIPIARDLGRSILLDPPASWDAIFERISTLGVRHGI